MMGVHSVSSGAVAFIAAVIQMKSIHVLRRLDFGCFLCFGEAQRRFRELGSYTGATRVGGARLGYRSSPISFIPSGGASRLGALVFAGFRPVFRCETESHCRRLVSHRLFGNAPILPRSEADIQIGH
jgi:hypothetical protein